MEQKMFCILVKIFVKDSILKFYLKLFSVQTRSPTPQTKSNSLIKPIKWMNLSQHEINKLLFKI